MLVDYQCVCGMHGKCQYCQNYYGFVAPVALCPCGHECDDWRDNATVYCVNCKKEYPVVEE